MEELIQVIQELGKPSTFDKVEVIVSIISTVISALALIVAIRIPKRIASSQNDIELFEKRYQLYKTLYPILDFGKKLLQVKEENVKRVSEKTRARYYLMIYLMAKGRDIKERIDIGLSFEWIYDKNNIFKGYSVSRDEGLGISTYKRDFEKHMDCCELILRSSSFLFNDDIGNELRKLASSYFDFMYLVLNNSNLENNTINDYDDEELKMLEFVSSDMEKMKKEFLDVINSMSHHDLLNEVEKSLRIKDGMKYHF